MNTVYHQKQQHEYRIGALPDGVTGKLTFLGDATIWQVSIFQQDGSVAWQKQFDTLNDAFDEIAERYSK